jgi:flagellar M-ring protein FliF
LTTAQGPTSQRTSETKNNEIGVTKVHTIQPAGEIERLSVAVIVDDDQQVKAENGKSAVTRTKRTSEELKKFENLVASSVGFNSERGDRVMVENIAFASRCPGSRGPACWCAAAADRESAGWSADRRGRLASCSSSSR